MSRRADYRARDPNRARTCDRCRNLADQVEQTLGPSLRRLLDRNRIDWRRPTEIELCSCRSNLALYLLSCDVIPESEPKGGESYIGTGWIAVCRREPAWQGMPAATHQLSLARTNVAWIFDGPTPNDDEWSMRGTRPETPAVGGNAREIQKRKEPHQVYLMGLKSRR